MKKYLLGVFAVVLAVGFSAFTSTEAPKAEKKQSTVYLIYNAGAQNAIGSYTQTTVVPNCPLAVRLCAIRVQNDQNGVVTQAEFTPIFNSLNITNPSSPSLDDEAETATLLKKS
jgi:hypothetical protein